MIYHQTLILPAIIVIFHASRLIRSNASLSHCPRQRLSLHITLSHSMLWLSTPKSKNSLRLCMLCVASANCGLIVQPWLSRICEGKQSREVVSSMADSIIKGNQPRETIMDLPGSKAVYHSMPVAGEQLQTRANASTTRCGPSKAICSVFTTSRRLWPFSLNT